MIEKLIVNEKCIACGMCEKICPSNFKVDYQSTVISQDFSNSEKILEAEKNCPVSAICVKQDKESIKLRKKVKLIEKKLLTKDVFELIFEAEDFYFVAGQFVSFFLQDEKGDFTRSYSIIPNNEKGFVLCIKIENGRGSDFIKKVEVGSILYCTEAKGNFVLQKTNREKVFIATGTGIAPIISMLKNCENNIKKTVIFGLRYEEDVFYKNLLSSFLNTNFILTLSKAGKSWDGKKGRVTNYLDNISKNAEIYICGSPQVLNSSLEKVKNHPKELIFYESFGNIKSKKLQNKSKGFDFIDFIQNFLYIFAIFSPFIYFFPEKWGLLWDISWYSLTILMLLRPISEIFSNISFLKKLIVLRKGLGILSSSIVILAGLYNYLPMGIDFFNIYFSLNHWNFKDYSFFAHMGELTGFILFITSNIFSQKLLGKYWKSIQKLSYVYFITGGIFIYSIGKEIALYSILFVFITIIISKIKNIIWKK